MGKLKFRDQNARLPKFGLPMQYTLSMMANFYNYKWRASLF